MDVRAGAGQRARWKMFPTSPVGRRRHAAVHPVRPALRAAARTAAPASAQQQRDPSRNQSPCGTAGSDVPHPHLIAACYDPSVLGDAVFYLMEPVDGFNAGEGLPPLHAGDPSVRFQMGLSMADALAKPGAVFHHPAVGLADFGKPAGLPGAAGAALALGAGLLSGVRKLPGAADPRGRSGSDLAGAQPSEDLDAGHHAWRLPRRQCAVLRTGPEVVAIVDWEMCTIGDPLLDLGWLLATWRQPDGSSVFSHALGGAGWLGQHRRSVPAVCRQHHSRLVADRVGTPCWPASSSAS